MNKCVFGHKWTKWEKIDIEMNLIKDGKTYPYIKIVQERSCLRCGKIKREAI